MIQQSAIKRAITAFAMIILTGCAATGMGAPAANQPQSTSFFLFNTLYFFALVYLGYYMLILRPKITLERQHRDYVLALKKGSEVMTSGGIFGRVVSVQGDIVTIEVDTNIRMRVHSEHVREPKLAGAGAPSQASSKSAQG